MSGFILCISSAVRTMMVVVQLIAMLLVVSKLQLFLIFGLGFRLSNHCKSFLLQFLNLFLTEIPSFRLRIRAHAFPFCLRLWLSFLLIFGLVLSLWSVLLVSPLYVSWLLTRPVLVIALLGLWLFRLFFIFVNFL